MATRINIPISVSDVAECLGVSSLSVGALCTSDAVSPWAKFKPTRIASNPITTPANWWQADQNTGNDCGFDVPILTLNTGALNSNSLINLFTDDGNNNWNYLQPTTGYWKRLLDFNGYYHLAAPPFSLGSDVINAYEGDESVTIMPMISAYSGDDVLKIKDFAFAANTKYYLGAFLVGTVSGNTYYKRHISTYEVTADNSGDISGSSGNLPTLPIADLPLGTYTIYTIIGSASIGYDSNGNEEANQSISVMPCPCVPPITLNILEVKEPYMLTASYKRQIGGSIEPSFTFTNQTIYSVQIKDIKAKYLLGGSWDNVAVETGWGSSITVPMNSSYTPTLNPALIPTQTSSADRVGIELTVVVLDEKGNPTGETITMRAVSAIIFTPSGGLTVVSE